MSGPHLSSVRQWPYRPDFNQFKRQAKELLKAYRAGDASAVAEVERHDDAGRVRHLVASDPSLLENAEGLLTQFAESGCVNVVRLLVERGASVNGKAGRPVTP